MAFANLARMNAKYTEEPMKSNIQILTDFDIYHCLLAGGMPIALKVQRQYKAVPLELLDWLKYCNGGLLFDTVLLTTKEHDDELDLDFDTYDEYNTDEARKDYGLPEGYVVFAVRSYGDPICFRNDEPDEKIYLWDVELQEFTDIWDSFGDWLTEELDEAVQLIADDDLDPLAVKLDGDNDE